MVPWKDLPCIPRWNCEDIPVGIDTEGLYLLTQKVIELAQLLHGLQAGLPGGHHVLLYLLCGLKTCLLGGRDGGILCPSGIAGKEQSEKNNFRLRLPERTLLPFRVWLGAVGHGKSLHVKPRQLRRLIERIRLAGLFRWLE